MLDVELFLEEQKLEAELLRLLERLLLTLLLALLVPDAPPEYPLSLSHLQQTNNKRQFRRQTAKGRRENVYTTSKQTSIILPFSITAN